MYRMKQFKFFGGLVVLLLAVSACGTSTTATYESAEITLSLDEELYAGANTVQGDWNVSLSDIAKAAGVDPKKIKEIRLKQVTVTVDDAEALAIMQEFTLQFAAKSVAMQKMAFVNPVPQQASTFTLNVAEDQKKLLDFFKAEGLILVADVNIADDYEAGLNLKLKLALELVVAE
jgi:hypothetical protein